MFFQSTGQNVPLWGMLLGIILSGIFSVVVAFLGYFFGRRRDKAETTSIVKKNEKQTYQNIDYGNEVINRMAAEIHELRMNKIELERDCHEKDSKIQTLAIQKAERDGAVAQVLQEKEDILKKVIRLEREFEAEKLKCHQQIAGLEISSQRKTDYLMKKIEELENFLHEKGIQFVSTVSEIDGVPFHSPSKMTQTTTTTEVDFNNDIGKD